MKTSMYLPKEGKLGNVTIETNVHLNSRYWVQKNQWRTNLKIGNDWNNTSGFEDTAQKVDHPLTSWEARKWPLKYSVLTVCNDNKIFYKAGKDDQ